MSARRRWIFGGAGLMVVAAFLVARVAVREGRLEVGIKFTHREAYPRAVFEAWVTNGTARPIRLDDAEVHFQSDGGSDSLNWSHWDGAYPLPPDQPLQPQAMASFSLSASDSEKQGRLVFQYT